MAVPGADTYARDRLRTLLHGSETEHGVDEWLRPDPLPDGLRATGEAGVLPPPVGGYLAPQTYLDADLAGATLSVDPRAASTGDDYTRYRKASADITMRGGTTSGIVYPLAVCEIARSFRLRNIGGTSAGALAAAAAAAAELGRAREAAGVPDLAVRGAAVDDGGESVHRGFAGLAQITQWLTQLDAADDTPDAHRLASLFAPRAQEWPMWGIVDPLVRRKGMSRAAWHCWWAQGRTVWPWLAAVLAIVALAVPVLSIHATGRSWPWSIACGVVGTVAVLGVIASVVALAVTRGAARKRRARADAQRRWSEPSPDSQPSACTRLRTEHTSAPAPAGRSGPAFAAATTAILLGLLTVVLAVATPDNWLAILGRFVGSATALIVLNVAVLAVGATGLNRRAQYHGYGLLAGKHLMEWLDHRLRELAGQDGPVTFGDLWIGGGIRSEAMLTGAATDPRRRVVNLQLVTTDLCQQRPFVFPLDTSAGMEQSIGSAFYVRRADLDAMFHEHVVERIAPNGVAPIETQYWSEETGNWEDVELYRLPEPWDLPVIFAVRTSMALPGLFKAVHIFRSNSTSRVRDDLGRTIVDDDNEPVRTPLRAHENYFDDMWLSDGGITSNFPVHLFDSPLPQWPTFALNLGPHPPGFEHQDVWSPEDWQGTVAPMTPVQPSMPGFLGAIFATASAWRDVMQTSMPSTRGRVAWVRQRGDEGGTNLYMSRDTVASMAIRGALAGARMRWRYGVNPTRWRRHEWLRLRTALRSLDELREATAFAAAPYQGLLAAQDPTVAEVDLEADDVEGFAPTSEAFWADATTLLTATGAAPPAAQWVLRDGAPAPAPEFRQLPRM